MKIINLIDDNKGNSLCLYEHGLSFYIETKKHKILCDTGSSGAIINNAIALNIDLSKLDVIFLSHGHYDHTGGLLTLPNNNARIYLSAFADKQYISLRDKAHYIGIDSKIMQLSNLRLINGNYVIDDELSIFTSPKRNLYPSFANELLKEKINDELIQDSFKHEQYLAIKEDNKYYLFSGCCHRGIINIIEEFKDIYKCYPNYVISGFHFQKEKLANEDINIIENTALYLNKLNIKYYTCHCTGIEAYNIMKPILNDKIALIKSGEEIK